MSSFNERFVICKCPACGYERKLNDLFIPYGEVYETTCEKCGMRQKVKKLTTYLDSKKAEEILRSGKFHEVYPFDDTYIEGTYTVYGAVGYHDEEPELTEKKQIRFASDGQTVENLEEFVAFAKKCGCVEVRSDQLRNELHPPYAKEMYRQ